MTATMMCESVPGRSVAGLGRRALAWLGLLLVTAAVPRIAAAEGAFTVSFAALANGNLSGSLLQTVLPGAGTTPVSALPDTGHHFTQWLLDGQPFGTDNPLTVPVVNADLAFAAQFAPDTVTFTVTFAAGANGSLSGVSPQTVAYGENATALTAVPASGYHFARWRLGADTYGTQNPLTVINVTADLAVTAEFAPDTYAVRFQAGANGAVSGEALQQVSLGGSSSAVSAVPALGYHFARWTLAGVEYSTENPLTVLAVSSAVTLTAEFAVNTYTVTFTADGNGTLLGATPQTVDYGANGTPVEAVANPGYHFVRWTVGGAPYAVANPIRLRRVSADTTLTAEFAANTYAVIFQAGPNGGLLGRTTQVVTHGADASTVTAVANTGHHVVGWTLDGAPYSAEPTLLLTNVTGPLTLTAEFAIDVYTVTYLAGPGGSLTGASAQTVPYGQNASPVAALPVGGYHFVHWLSDGQLFSTDSPITLRNVSENLILTAEFAVNTYTVTFIAGANGGIAGGATVQTVTHGGSAAAVNAVANYGYHFLRWSLNSALYSSTASLAPTNVTENLIFVADFEINSYTVTFTAGSNGSLSGTSAQTLIHGAATLPVTAVPATGYHFVRWVQGESHFSTGNPLTVSNVTATLTLTAEFALNVYPVVFLPGSHGSVAGEPYQAIPHGSDSSAVTVIPAYSYHFLRWTLDGSEFSLDNPLTLTNVVTPVTVVAEYQINAYAVAFQAGPNGTLAGDTAQTVTHGGSAAAVTAQPQTGYHFLRWTLDGAVYSFDNPVIARNVTGDRTLTAEFEINVYTVTFLAGPHGSISGQTVQRVAHGGSSSPVTATADLEYMFALWSDGFSINPRVLDDVTGDLTVTAQFRDAAAAIPTGTFLAAIDLADVVDGRGLWDLTGHYETLVAGRQLTLDLTHDTKGKISGGGSLHTAAADGRPIIIPVSAKGAAKGVGGAVTVTLTLSGSQAGTATDATLIGSATIKLTLTLDLANRRLLGAGVLTQKIAKISTTVSTYVTLDLPAGSDGTYDILFELVQVGSKTTGNATLRLSNGADYLFAVKGTNAGNICTLALTGHTTDTAAKSIKITTTMAALEGHAAHLNTLTASGYGQTIRW
jgi:hypothetical protein